MRQNEIESFLSQPNNLSNRQTLLSAVNTAPNMDWLSLIVP